jgi:hypothetical protein
VIFRLRDIESVDLEALTFRAAISLALQWVEGPVSTSPGR